MKAMILAAGIGSRLRPLTDHMPKALVEVEGIPILQRVILKLREQGFDKIVVNTHHFSNQIKDFLEQNDFGVEVNISDESNALLDTGGGIAEAYSLLFEKDYKPVLFHNVDILSNADLRGVIEGIDDEAGGVLLVSDRESTRKLLFDDAMRLQGWHDLKNCLYKPEGFLPKDGMREFAFSGIYAMSKRGVEEMKELLGEGKYSVMDYFLHPGRSFRIDGMLQQDLKLLDIGKPATLARASELLKNLK